MKWLLLTFFFAMNIAWAAPCSNPDNISRVTGGGECLVIKTYPEIPTAKGRNLFILLHGNHTSGGPANSMFLNAEKLAATTGDVTVAIVRPGYNDAEGNYSSGQILGRADNFTAENIDIIAAAIAELKDFHQANQVILIGHSGGAAISGVIMGRHPNLAARAVLAACPCDVPFWRGMSRAGTPWQSLSPHDFVDKIPAGSKTIIIVGEDDSATPPVLSRNYHRDLQKRGLSAELIILPGVTHASIINHPELNKAAITAATLP